MIELDGVSYTIPAGCYELQELLARLNALSSAVFSYVSSGEDCYKLTISGCEKISCSDELANMLGLEGISKGEEVETVRYQLTEEANMFVYKNSNASYIIPCIILCAAVIIPIITTKAKFVILPENE